MPRGGSRPGSGRKRKAVAHAREINAAEKRLAGGLADRLTTMEKIAIGDVPVIEETYEPAGVIMIEYVHVVTDDRGNEKAVKGKRLAYPELAEEDPDQLVLVKRVVKNSGPDRAANEYLMNRIMGAPTQKHEFSSLSDAELIEEAKSLFGGDDSAGDSPDESE